MIDRKSALLLGALLLGACSDSTGPARVEPGTFEATITGDHTAEMEGMASIEGGFLPENTTAILLTDGRVPGESRQMVMLARSRPGPATYPTGRAGSGATFTSSFLVFDAATENVSLSATSTQGTVTVEEATAEVIRGSFDFTAVTAVQPARTVRVVGRFHATRQPALPES